MPRLPDPVHEEMESLIDALLRRQGWSWQGVEQGAYQLTDEPVTFDRLQALLIKLDPVLWVETHLLEPAKWGGGMVRLWPYQRGSLRYRGPVIHMDAAEVGKSREIYMRLGTTAADTKLTAAYFDRVLGTVSTFRNWRTVMTLVEMAGDGAV